MEKVFYAVITQYDCDPNKNPPDNPEGARGPLLLERYLDNESALSEESTREVARQFEGSPHNYGWARVAKIIVDIPGE